MIIKNLPLIIIVIQSFILHLNSKLINAKKRNEIDENLLQTQCSLKFYEKYGGDINNETIFDCIKNIRKLGKCPKNYETIKEPMSCLQTCNYDYKCSGIKKCCHQDCGWICQEPDEIKFNKNLPPIPYNLSLPIRKHKGRSCEISWFLPLNRTDTKPIMVIIEGRSHIGSVFSPHKLGDWQWFDAQRIADITIKPNSFKNTDRIKLRKGRWYQFRVAAVNEYGFKGYSNLSKPYKLSDFIDHITDPKIPIISNFTITKPKLLNNGSVYAKAIWIPEKSDIPIDKYHISWALHLKAENDSLFLNDAFVKEPIRYYEFWNLNINSTYYVQVKTISIHGKRKLKSPKEPFLLNTTLPWNKEMDLINWNNKIKNNLIKSSSSSSLSLQSSYINATAYSLKNSHKKFNSNFRTNTNMSYKFIPNRKYGIIIRIFFNRELYSEKFLLEICPGTTADCETKEYEAAKAKRDHIDFSIIKFKRNYTLRLIDLNSLKKHHILWSKTITTPSCENWLKTYPHLSISC